MFGALTCPSSGGKIVFTQHLVSSLSVNGCTVHRLFFFNNLDWGPVPRLPPGSTAANVAHCTIPRSLNVLPLSARCLSRPHPAVAPSSQRTMGEKWWPNSAWDMHPGFFYMPQICDMGPIILLPFRRKAY